MKRLLDFTLALALLVASLPLLLCAVIAIHVEDGWPWIFSQKRVGRGGSEFVLHKLRTMRIGSGPSVTMSRDSRILRTGRFLRATKIDELPQLVNILRGDMSFVGPRPEVPEMVARMDTESARRRHEVRPGLTSPASIEFIDEERILASYADPSQAYVDIVLPRKVQLDVTYAQDRTFTGDICIMAKTAAALFWRKERADA